MTTPTLFRLFWVSMCTVALALSACGDSDVPEAQLGCRLNSDCALGELCNEGTCVPDETPDGTPDMMPDGCGDNCPCVSDVDCDSSDRCDVDTGECVARDCFEDRECPLGNVCDGGQCITDVNADRDKDGVPDAEDVCPEVPDTGQDDLDGDGLGDVCDDDLDGDGTPNSADNCPRDRSDDVRDLDEDGAGDICDLDDDGDGLTDTIDNCPVDPNPGQADGDGDGIGDACDLDRDRDDVQDEVDNCPEDANTNQSDLDVDGLGDVCDDDLDGDGVLNGADNCPRDAFEDQTDTDEDGQGDFCDEDIDGDGLTNTNDNCPRQANPDQANRDGDERGDACDLDLDGDGAPDNLDNCPGLPNPDQADLDDDGAGDACDIDIDGDGVANPDDSCPRLDTPELRDTDGDGDGDACDLDDDNDGVTDGLDNCQRVPNADQSDIDENGVGDACDGDLDVDGVVDNFDNCPAISNAEQSDIDGDGDGDACDLDIDGDGVLNVDDNCPALVTDNRLDLDGDGIGDACDPDIDGDGVDNFADNCPRQPNADQADTEQGDGGAGDACDDDGDDDGILARNDNCVDVANADQADFDGDFLGDACDPDTDNDGIDNDDDNCPFLPSRNVRDRDADGIGDICDLDDDNDGVLDDGDDSGDARDNPCEPGQDIGCDDNCRLTDNRDQSDDDLDGTGDGCERDRDLDGVIDDLDVCVLLFNPDQADLDFDGIGDACDPDIDGDLVANPDDNCPRLATSLRTDLDLDGVGDACDPDIDGDRVANTLDNCPRVSNADQIDDNTNGIGDACDLDSDGDRVIDAFDNCPLTPNTDQSDLDSDTLGDACDPDLDGDGLINGFDNCAQVPNRDQRDLDNNGDGDACDDDIDGDTVPNDDDNCPRTPNADQTDLEQDGIGDACQADLDGDGIFDDSDNCVVVPNPDQADLDNDGQGDVCDSDDDDDRIPDNNDNCPLTPNTDQRNTDGDGEGDACDLDVDGDGVSDLLDNCPLTPNANQADVDDDGRGDACEFDLDDDGLADVIDNCPTLFNPGQDDLDLDGQGDVCDSDTDGDGILDDADNCPRLATLNVRDLDDDGEGDACDDDVDGDTVPNTDDNCPLTPNADQADDDNDGIGDLCREDADSDGVTDNQDNCPSDANTDQTDTDGDGLGDACDNDADNDTIANGIDNCPLTPNPSQEDAVGMGFGLGCAPAQDDRTLDFGAGTNNLNVDTRGLEDRQDLPCGGAGAPDLTYTVALDSQEKLSVALFALHQTVIGLETEDGELIECIRGSELAFQAPATTIPDNRVVYRLVIDGAGPLDFGPLTATLARQRQSIVESTVHDMRGFEPNRLGFGRLVGDDDTGDIVALNTSQNNLLIINGEDNVQSGPFPTGLEPSGLIVVDLDGDGLQDVLVSNEGSDSISFMQGRGGDQALANAQAFPVGSSPVAIGAGHFNDDDALDIVSANRDDDNLTVWFGALDGPFDARVDVALPPGSRPKALAVSDIDGDGFDDIAVTHDVLNQSEGAFTVLFGQADTPLSTTLVLPAGDGPVSVAASDINGDQNVDIAVLNGVGQSVMVRLGLGQRAFSEPRVFAAGSGPSQLGIGDVNGDGAADLFLVRTQANRVFVFPGTGDDETLLSVPALSFNTGATADTPTDVRLVEVAGLPQLIVSGSGDLPTGNDPRPSDTTSVARLVMEGSFLFHPPVHTERAFSSVSERIWQGDLDRDGAIDFVRARSSAVDITWGASPIEPARQLLDIPTGITPQTFQAADIDGDGYLDFVISGGTSNINVTVLRSLRGRGFELPRIFPTRSHLDRLAIFDIDNDGHQDIVTKHREGDADEMLILWGLPGINFEPADSFHFDDARNKRQGGLFIGHVDDDPFADIVFGENDSDTYAVYWGAPGRQFEPIFKFSGLGLAQNVLGTNAADLDLDGHKDIIIKLSGRVDNYEIHFGDGVRSFGDAVRVRIVGNTAQLEEDDAFDIIHDIDDDGYPDILFGNVIRGPNSRPFDRTHDAQIARVFSGPGGGVTMEQNVFGHARFQGNNSNPGWRAESFVLADPDSDGLMTLFASHLLWEDDTNSTRRATQVFTNGVREGQGPGHRFADADLPPCACTVVSAAQPGSEAIFDVQPGQTCAVTRVELDVTLTEGDGRPAAINLVSPADDAARLVPHGATAPTGRWVPRRLSNLARFEGTAATGQWRLTGQSPVCVDGDLDCPALHRFESATLRLNCAPVDPFGEAPAPVCANGQDAPGESEQACALALDADVAGDIGPNDRDLMVLAGPVSGGFELGDVATVTVSLEASAAPPVIALTLVGARHPLATASRLGPDDDRPGFDRWEASVQVTEALVGRYLALDFSPGPSTLAPLDYTVTASVE